MPLLRLSLFCFLFHVILLPTLSVFAQTSESSVYVYANDTSKWNLRGSWTLIHVLDNFADNWLVPNITGSDETSASISFTGTAVVLFGTVVNGTQGQPMNVSVLLDSDPVDIPTYTPGGDVTTSGVDNNNRIFIRASLPYQLHTLKLTVTGNTPFFLRGALYNATPPSTQASASISVGPTTTPSSTSDSPGASNDTPKLAGAIGGGVGALLLVGIIILFMMRRVRRIEENEKKLQAIPFIGSSTGLNRSQTGIGAYTPTATARSAPRTHTTSSTAVEEKFRMKDHYSTAPSSSRSLSRAHKSQPSPAASLISIPSEFQHGTTVVPGGTAVASSYIGTSPLPPIGLPGPGDDMPPVPPMPTDVKYRTKSMKSREKQERQEKQEKQTRADPSTPHSGLGLFSNDSVNTLGSTGSGLSRPLPIVPGTRSSAPSYSFPPEKMGLSPPPAQRTSGSTSTREKRPLPETTYPPPSR